jgi:hypothetical protein
MYTACISGDARPPVVLRREGMERMGSLITNLTRWYRHHKHHTGQRSQSFSAQAQAVSFLLTGHEVGAQRTANKTRQEANGKLRKEKRTYHRCPSILRIHPAVIFRRCLTVVVRRSLYFSSSLIGKTLANQKGNNAGSFGG